MAVTTESPGPMTSVNCFDTVKCVGAVESVTLTPTVLVEGAVGLPLITPALLILKPVGSPDAVQVYGAVPPLAVSVTEYAVPAGSAGSPVVVMEGPDLMMMFRLLAIVRCVGEVESVAVIIAVAVPVAVGVPEITPVEGAIVSPAGRPLADHE
jgi:hypothetical protein